LFPLSFFSSFEKIVAGRSVAEREINKKQKNQPTVKNSGQEEK